MSPEAVGGPAQDSPPDARATTIYFLHGLGGDRRSTWTAPASGAAEPAFWPDWVQEDCPWARVYTIGYQAPATAFTANQMDLDDRVTNLGTMLLSHQGEGEGPIVFIAHSLGGVLVSQLVARVLGAADRPSDTPETRRLRRVVRRIRLVVLLGSPLSGARLVDLLPSVLLSKLTLGLSWSSSGYLKGLSARLHELSRPRGLLPRFVVIHEGRRQWLLLLVVEPTGAKPYALDVRTIRINKNHTQLAKPTDRTDTVYQEVIDALKALRSWRDDCRQPLLLAAGAQARSPALRLPRAWLREHLVALWQGHVKGRYVVLDTNPGWGKTTFFESWIRDETSRKSPPLSGWVFATEPATTADPEHQRRHALALVRTAIDAYPALEPALHAVDEASASVGFFEHLDTLVQHLGEAVVDPSRHPAVLLIDHLDALLPPPGVPSRPRLPELPDGVHVILSRRAGPPLDQLLDISLARALIVVAPEAAPALAEQASADLRAYIARRLEDIRSEEVGGHIRDIAERLVKEARGSVQVVQQYIGAVADPWNPALEPMLKGWSQTLRQPALVPGPEARAQLAATLDQFVAGRPEDDGLHLGIQSLACLAVFASMRRSMIDEAALFDFLAPAARVPQAPETSPAPSVRAQRVLGQLRRTSFVWAYNTASALLGRSLRSVVAAHVPGHVFQLKPYRDAVRWAWQQIDTLDENPPAASTGTVLARLLEAPHLRDPRWIFDGPTAQVHALLADCCAAARQRPAATTQAVVRYALHWETWHRVTAGAPRPEIVQALLADQRLREVVRLRDNGAVLDVLESTLRQMWRRCLVDARGRRTAPAAPTARPLRLSDVFLVLHKLERRWERSSGPPLDTVEGEPPLLGMGRRFLQMLAQRDRLAAPTEVSASIDELLRALTLPQLLCIVRYAVSHYETALLHSVIETLFEALDHGQDARWTDIERFLVERADYVTRYTLATVQASRGDAARLLERVEATLAHSPSASAEEYGAYTLSSLLQRRDDGLRARVLTALDRLADSPVSGTRLAVLHAFMHLLPALEGPVPERLLATCARMTPAIAVRPAMERDSLALLAAQMLLMRPELTADARLAGLLPQAAPWLTFARSLQLEWEQLGQQLSLPVVRPGPGDLPDWLRANWLMHIPAERLRVLLRDQPDHAVRLLAFLLSNPVWDLVEEAASLAFDVLTRSTLPARGPGSAENVLQSLMALAEQHNERGAAGELAQGHRLLVGVIELTYLYGGGDPEHFMTLVQRHYRHPVVVVQAQLAENLVARILHHQHIGRDPDDYLASFALPLRHWLESAEPWILEQMHRLAHRLPVSCRLHKRLIQSARNPILPQGDWWALSRSRLLEGIALRQTLVETVSAP